MNMGTITYRNTPTTDVAVYVDGRRSGTIKQLAQNQFVYVPTGGSVHDSGAECFPTLGKCKRSLEG